MDTPRICDVFSSYIGCSVIQFPSSSRSYGYLSVSDFKSECEQLFISGFKNSYLMKGEFTKDECEYLKQKYEFLSVCDMIPLGWKY